jgi:Trk-type K+ transport system membrane component
VLEVIGWIATAVFASSYFSKEPKTLRRLQAAAALLWIAYGVILKAPPVIVANVIVASLALWSSLATARPRSLSLGPSAETLRGL